MNIVQMHAKTMFFLDAERSPRFRDIQVDKALNTALNDIILDRYNNIQKGQQSKEYSFQSSQRLRDELYTLVKYQGNLNVTQPDLVPIANFPSDYMYMLILEAVISGMTINTIPVTYDELNVIQLNPFFRPSLSWPQRIYRIESTNGVKIVFGEKGILQKANMYYISKPAKVFLGDELKSNMNPYPVVMYNNQIVAYVPSVIEKFNNSSVSLGYKSLDEEEDYLVGTDGEYFIKSYNGIVYYNHVNCDLPDALHEEVCRKAAAILSGNVENYNREKSLEKDINK